MCFSIVTDICNLTTINFTIISSSHKNPPLSYFLSYRFPYFWTFHVNGNHKSMDFCGWLFKFGLGILKFIQVVACVNITYLIMAK